MPGTQNTARDFKRWCKSSALAVSHIITTQKRIDRVGFHETNHAVLWPFDVVGAAFDILPREDFQKMMFGPNGVSGVHEFWEKQKNSQFVKQHPGFQKSEKRSIGPPTFTEAAPIHIHADWGQHINQDKILVCSWGSSLCKLITKLGLFLFTILPANLCVPEVTEGEIYRALVWAMGWMALGIYPDHDYVTKKPFKEGTRRAILAGRYFAGGLALLFSDYIGDWEWHLSAFKWRGCGAQKCKNIIVPLFQTTHVIFVPRPQFQKLCCVRLVLQFKST